MFTRKTALRLWMCQAFHYASANVTEFSDLKRCLAWFERTLEHSRLHRHTAGHRRQVLDRQVREFWAGNVDRDSPQADRKTRVAFLVLSKFPRKPEDHPAAPSATLISCALLICINVSKGCRSILAGAFIGCAAVKQCWRIRRANGRNGKEKTNIKCQRYVARFRLHSASRPSRRIFAVLDFWSETCEHIAVCLFLSPSRSLPPPFSKKKKKVFFFFPPRVFLKRLHSPEVAKLHPHIGNGQPPHLSSFPAGQHEGKPHSLVNANAPGLRMPEWRSRAIPQDSSPLPQFTESRLVNGSIRRTTLTVCSHKGVCHRGERTEQHPAVWIFQPVDDEPFRNGAKCREKRSSARVLSPK